MKMCRKESGGEIRRLQLLFGTFLIFPGGLGSTRRDCELFADGKLRRTFSQSPIGMCHGAVINFNL